MPALKHPLTGAIYTLRADGLVDVDNNGLRGVFYFDGRHHSGDLQVADPHMLCGSRDRSCRPTPTRDGDIAAEPYINSLFRPTIH